MKVLKIIHTKGHGGAESVFRWLSRGLLDAGHEIVAGIPLDNDPRDPENWIAAALAEVGVPCETFDRRGSGRALLGELTSLVRRVEPQVVHSHLLDSNFYSALACRRLGVPHVSTEHGDIALKRDLASRLKFALLPFLSGAVVCVSDALRRRAATLTPRAGRLHLIYNGMKFADSGPSTFREEAGIPGGALVVGNVGNLYPVKGQRYLIEALASILGALPDTWLVLVGRGGEMETLQDLAQARGVAGRVLFTGFRADVANILGALDIYVQPSLSEGLPMAVLEALARGVPVVATDVGGVGEIVRGEPEGSLVPPGSAGALVRAIRGIAEDRPRWAALAEQRRARVRERFSLEAMCRAYERLYEHAALGRGA